MQTPPVFKRWLSLYCTPPYVAGVGIYGPELRGSVTTSQSPDRLGAKLQLELLYTSRTNNIFTEANLRAIKALEAWRRCKLDPAA